MPGHQFTYGFDDIGNRKAVGTAAGGNEKGSGLSRIAYQTNELNQYTSVATPGRHWITGEAVPNSQTFVNGAYAWRKERFFAKEMDVDNSSGPVSVATEVLSKLPGAGSGGATVVQEQTGDLLIPPAAATPTYDEDGNLVSDGLWTYTWDAENRLIEMHSASAVPNVSKRKLMFGYDCNSRRLTKAVYTWNSGTSDYYTVPATSIKFVYDKWHLMSELDELNSNQAIRSYIWGADLSGALGGAGGVGGLLSITMHVAPGASTTYLCFDPNGNISALINAANGSLAGCYEYNPFGELLRQSGPMASTNPFRFSTKYNDIECGLTYFGYRYYNPNLGCWLNRDPIGEVGGTNLYAFVGNRSVDRVDVLGLIDRRKVMNGKILYSCRCGWIDEDHVGTRNVAEAALEAIGRYETKGPDSFSLEASHGAGPISTGVRVTYKLTYGNPLLFEPLSRHDKNELALSIFLDIERRFERHQGSNAFWSSFSVEDMPSNYLGFLLATGDISSIKEACDPLTKEESIRMFNYGYGPEKNREIQPKLWTYLGFRAHPAGFVDIDPAAKSDPGNCDPCKRKDKTKPKFFDLYSPSQKSGYFNATQVDFYRYK